jgi:hypothetical protein
MLLLATLKVSVRDIGMLRRIASFGLAVVLTATLLWGGCLSCAHYFMFPSIGEKSCCRPSGECRKTTPNPNNDAPSSPQGCHIQPVSFSASPAELPQPEILVNSFDFPPVQPPGLTVAPRPNPQSAACLANQASPPDLCLYHSVFLI